MMKMMLLKTHYTADEAHSLMVLLDEIRDAIWDNYRDEIIEYCHQQQTWGNDSLAEIEDDQIPF